MFPSSARPGGVGNYLRPQLFDLLDELSRIVFSFGTPHARGRAILCLVYSLALHNHFYEARLLLLSSKVHEKILEVLPRISDSVQEQMEKDNRAHRDSSKIYRQFLYRHLDDLILYHRVLAQLGLAAFRKYVFVWQFFEFVFSCFFAVIVVFYYHRSLNIF